jgi:hypothetical protein
VPARSVDPLSKTRALVSIMRRGLRPLRISTVTPSSIVSVTPRRTWTSPSTT